MPKFSKYSKIFEPIKIGTIELKNRIEFTPLVSCHADADGRVTTELVEFLGGQARTGAGLINIGATAVNGEKGEDFLGAMSVTRDSDILGLSRLADEVHKYGAKLGVELNHAGRAALLDLLKGDALAPSSIPLPGKSRYIKEMDQRDIDQVINEFADCSERCMKAGFDVIMLHGAHGNLLAQFLSPLSNKRTDCYGGSAENRMRFPLEVIRAVRERCGNKIAIEYRISADEYAEDGMRLDDVIEFLKVAQKDIDMAHISAGLIVDFRYIKKCVQPSLIEHCINVPFSEKVKAALNIPVAVVGSISTMDDAEKILSKGKADVIGMARALLVDGATVTKAYRGQEDRIRPCIRCYNCLKEIFPGKPVRCSLNPVVGQEYKYRTIGKTDESKKVMIVGGGPAGMMAAQTAVKRGHEVVLYEQKAELGGLLHEASVLPIKEDLKRYTNWMIKETHRCGATLCLNTTVTKETVEEVNPDVLFIATGANPFLPPIEGINNPNVALVTDVDSKKVEVGQNVVVCGGGLSGTESAVCLAKEGKNVTLVDMMEPDELCKDVFLVNRIALMDLVEEYGVNVIGGVKIEKIDANGVHIIDKKWNRSVVEADSVVVALGLKSTTTTVNELKELVPETYVVGDCVKPKDIHNAIHSAFHFAVEM